jgi:peptidoglycan biosynthesis protein MviN/MurJ (putative lipid II flippase)
MKFLKQFSRYNSGSALLVGLTLATGAIFKMCAFAREAFIASNFGLSAVTDAYFGLQQFPASLVAFMFGAFSLAFTPAYADEERSSGSVEWLPGLLIYGCLIGTAMTVLMLACAPFLLHLIHSTGTKDVRSTLGLLSACYVPIICIGIWKSICTARGRNLWSMTLTGLPYLLMTLALFAAYAMGKLSSLSLPVSMAVGFGGVGLYSFVRILGSQPSLKWRAAIFSVWTVPQFRRFLRQLGASAVENAGFITNQILLLYFLSRLGTGVISANNCAMRIGMLGYSLLSQPLSNLVQSRLCSAKETERSGVFRRWLLIYGVLQVLFALAFYAFRLPILRLVYMHGKFTGTEVAEVASILPAWIAYCVVMSISGLTANYLFICSKGFLYMRCRLLAYVAANLLRFALIGGVGAAALIWFSVATEVFALALNLKTCLSNTEPKQVVSNAEAVAIAI